MRSRRHFVRLAPLALIVPAALKMRSRAAAQVSPQTSTQLYMPLVLGGSPPPNVPPDDMPILGPASGSTAQASAWLAAHCAAEYTEYDVGTIVAAYQDLGDGVGMDWFLAIAQMVHETGSLTSWWSGRPRRNPAGIAVTGTTRAGDPNVAPGPGWTWDDRYGFWREGWSFETWAKHAVPAHLGRLLAYALTDARANDAQRQLIDYALLYRGLPASYRGSAPTIVGLNGKWAVPGTTYGQRIIAVVWSMLG